MWRTKCAMWAPSKRNILDVLLAIEKQSQQRAQEMLNMLSRNSIYNPTLEFLRSEIRKRFGEGFCEARAEHYDELCHKSQPCLFNEPERDFARLMEL